MYCLKLYLLYLSIIVLMATGKISLLLLTVLTSWNKVITYLLTYLLWFMKFNATVNNISIIEAVSFIGERNRSTRRKPPAYRKLQTNCITCCIEYTSPWTGFELTALVVIGTDYSGSCKSKYHTNTATTTPGKNDTWNADIL